MEKATNDLENKSSVPMPTITKSGDMLQSRSSSHLIDLAAQNGWPREVARLAGVWQADPALIASLVGEDAKREATQYLFDE